MEKRIIAGMGGRIYGPYTGRTFRSRSEADIEHIVARSSEAHDSGLCAQPASVRRAFASDLLNLTLAAPEVNRCYASGKCGKDASEWMPQMNRCWFAGRIVEVKRRYGLSVDPREASALDGVLSGCSSLDMVILEQRRTSAPKAADGMSGVSGGSGPPAFPLASWDDNGNGKISCAEARRNGIAPVHRSHPAYAYMRDGDGTVCE